jgi:hypothetical protein
VERKASAYSKCQKHKRAFVGKECPICAEDRAKSRQIKSLHDLTRYKMNRGGEFEKQGLRLREEVPIDFGALIGLAASRQLHSIQDDEKRSEPNSHTIAAPPTVPSVSDLFDVNVIEPDEGDPFRFGIVATNKSDDPVLDVQVILQMPPGLQPIHPPVPYSRLGDLYPKETREAIYNLTVAGGAVRGDLCASIVAYNHEGKLCEPYVIRRSVHRVQEVRRQLSGIEKEELLQRIAVGLPQQKWSAPFIANPDNMFKVVMDRLSHLTILDDHHPMWLDKQSYNGVITMYGQLPKPVAESEASRSTTQQLEFAVRFSITGNRPPGESLLSLEIFGDDEHYLATYFSDMREMVQNIITLLSSAKEVKCEHCGAEPPDLSTIRGKTLVRCKFCDRYYRPPLWISTLALENS